MAKVHELSIEDEELTERGRGKGMNIEYASLIEISPKKPFTGLDVKAKPPACCTTSAIHTHDE